MWEGQIEIKNKLIIAFDAKRLFNNFTGLGNYARTLVKNLQKFYPQHEYHLFTPTIKVNEETAFFLNNSNFIIHRPKGFRPLWRYYGISKDINQLMPHIYHGLSHEIPLGLDKKIIKVVTFHDLIYEKFPLQFNWIDLLIYKFKYRSSARRVDHIIAISKSTKEDLKEVYKIKDEKISIIYQSCHETFQKPFSGQELLPDILKGLVPYFLYVGSIIERKGLLQTIIAFSSLPKEYKKPFVIVGSGDKKYRKKVDDLIRYYELEKHFIFINKIQNQTLAALYDHCFALIYPSVYEGFGIPVIECLFRNKPVITSDISSMPEAAGKGAILINPYSPEEIKNAMLRMEDKSIYSDLIDKGKDYVSTNFSSEVTARPVANLYERLVK